MADRQTDRGLDRSDRFILATPQQPMHCQRFADALHMYKVQQTGALLQGRGHQADTIFCGGDFIQIGQ